MVANVPLAEKLAGYSYLNDLRWSHLAEQLPDSFAELTQLTSLWLTYASFRKISSYGTYTAAPDRVSE